jgi:replicative superfamily II helicase
MKGRAGRYGKSKDRYSPVYILCDQERAEEVFTKFFLSSPDSILPKIAVEKEELATMVVTQAAGTTVTAENILRVSKRTLYGSYAGVRRSIVQKVLKDLVSMGVLIKRKNGYSLTNVGQKVNRADISPYDLIQIKRLKKKPSVRELISVASNIDLVLRHRKSSARTEDPTDMLLDWISEMPIDEIVMKYHDYWHDGDILLLGEYTAATLKKISLFIDDEVTKKEIESLRERLKFGVKEDIAKSGLTRISTIAINKARGLARSLFGKGYRNVKTIAKESADRLAKRLGISHTEASAIIADCQRLLEGQ